jgi:hypothetical protein
MFSKTKVALSVAIVLSAAFGSGMLSLFARSFASLRQRFATSPEAGSKQTAERWQALWQMA